MMREFIENQFQTYNIFSDSGFHLGASFMSPFRLQRAFLAIWFSEPLRGTPWTDAGIPGGTLGQIFLTC